MNFNLLGFFKRVSIIWKDFKSTKKQKQEINNI